MVRKRLLSKSLALDNGSNGSSASQVNTTQTSKVTSSVPTGDVNIAFVVIAILVLLTAGGTIAVVTKKKISCHKQAN